MTIMTRARTTRVGARRGPGMTAGPGGRLPPGPRSLLVPLLLVAGMSACGEAEPDAYGTFEAVEVVVSAEAAGQLVRLDAEEGQRLAAGVAVGQIDTVALALQRVEIAAQRGVTRTRATEADAQVGVLRAQLATAESEHQRTLRLFRAEAATAQQLDRAAGEVRVLRERIEAARAQRGTVAEEAGGADARIAQLEERIRRSRVVNPIGGTVLTRFAEPGELVQPGTPLYQIASLDTLTLRAYVSGAQLGAVRVGQSVTVRIDRGGELATLDGRVSWVASEAEFTPTPIQTRDERVDQVYAVKVRVPNPRGEIKIGMPGELELPGEGSGGLARR